MIVNKTEYQGAFNDTYLYDLNYFVENETNIINITLTYYKIKTLFNLKEVLSPFTYRITMLEIFRRTQISDFNMTLA